jgi:hypothetical protein
MAACSTDTVTDKEEPLPEGMGRIRITICTPEANLDQTRAVNVEPWEAPDHDWEKLQSYRILICDASDNSVVKIVTGSTMGSASTSTDESKYRQSADIITEIPEGNYHVFATANYNEGYNVYDVVDYLNKTEQFTNGYSDLNIPMTGKLTNTDGTLKTVNVSSTGTTDAGTITVWRVMSKLQFYFTNEATEQIKIYGVEVEPINTNASNQGLVYLFSKDDLTSTANLPVGGVTLPSGVTNGKARHSLTTPTDPLLTLAKYTGSGDKPKGNLFFYVNETNGTFTTTENEISLRFKIKRGDATEEELRYGLTTRYGDGSTGQDGFNVIRRNDWIHIPIIITDWQMRIEPLAFVPIAGYPPATVSSDGLTATYSTGGMIALQPFIRKKIETGYTTWLDFGNPEVTFVSISWKNNDGTNQSGTDMIVKTPFTYDSVNQFIVGELNSDKVGHDYKTTITINVDLGTSPVYHYTFSCNVILD